MNRQNNRRKSTLLKSQLLEGLEDRRLMATFSVTTNGNTGAGSLRDAINNANLSPGADTIAFNLPAGSRTITLTTALPALGQQTTIDGTTNPGYAGAPVVEITGNNTLVANGLVFNAHNNIVRGLSITGFAKDASFGFGRGIVLNGGNNLVEKNYLALKPDGVTNFLLGQAGVEIGGSSNTIKDNAIGLTRLGVFIDSSSTGASNNVITGNYLGTNASGSNYAGGTTLYYGVYIGNGTNNRVGGPAAGDRNIIAVGLVGVGVQGDAASTVVQNNHIGVNSGGAGSIVAAGANNQGVYIVTNSGGVQVRDNLIANAGGAQVAISSSSNVLLAGNKIGLNILGQPMGAGAYGVNIDGAVSDNNRIGTSAAADRNWIMNGTAAGIQIGESGSSFIQNNVIGIAPNGTVSASGKAIVAQAAGSPFKLGGLGANEGNIIAAATGFNCVELSVMAGGQTPGATTVAGNQIGMNLAGTAMATASFGVLSLGIDLSSTSNALIQNNKIAGVGTAIRNDGANYILGNQLGLDAAGANPIRIVNGVVTSNGGIVGGANAGEGNLVGDWDVDGIIVLAGTGTVKGNRIGTNLAGTGLYHGQYAIDVVAPGTVVGGTGAGEGNVVVGASGIGLRVAANNVTVRGNTVGLPGQPNTSGVYVIATTGTTVNNVVIGGDTAAAANTIAYNTGKGIVVQQSGSAAINNVTLRRNVIHSNGGLAIDLGNDGATPNDALDADTGANGMQNTPFLLGADSTGGTQTTVTGFMNSSASTPIVIDFYSADAASNEARTWLGSKTVFTDAAGGVSFTHSLPFVAGDKYIVATATNIVPFPNGATSELSPSVQVVGPSDTTAPSASSGQFNFETGHLVKLFFTEDLMQSSIGVADLQMLNTTTNVNYTPTSFSYDAANKGITFSFASPLPDGNYTYTLAAGTVSDLAGNVTTATYSNTTFVLAGDTNRDRSVNFNDLLTVAQNYGTAGKTFSQGDFNYDGNVNFNDLLIIAQKYGTSLFSSSPIVGKRTEAVAQSILN